MVTPNNIECNGMCSTSTPLLKKRPFKHNFFDDVPIKKVDVDYCFECSTSTGRTRTIDHHCITVLV